MTPVQKAKLNIKILKQLELDLLNFQYSYINNEKDFKITDETVKLIQEQRMVLTDGVLYGDNK